MAKDFNVTLKYVTAAGKVGKFCGPVTSVPGVDVFQTAREVATARVKAARKGTIARVTRAFAVAA